jgi:hypothetical protein
MRFDLGGTACFRTCHVRSETGWLPYSSLYRSSLGPNGETEAFLLRRQNVAILYLVLRQCASGLFVNLFALETLISWKYLVSCFEVFFLFVSLHARCLFFSSNLRASNLTVTSLSSIMATPLDEEILPNKLRSLRRYITAHDLEGKAVLSTSISEEALQWQRFPRAAMFLAYSTPSYPVNLQDDVDVAEYNSLIHNPPGLFFPGSTLCRILDLSPGEVSPMHRTQTLDYGVVLDGEVELILNDLEKPAGRRTMGRGDICVQRATLHAWRNMSPTQWARMMFVLIGCEKPVVNGVALGENMELVEGSLREILTSN